MLPYGEVEPTPVKKAEPDNSWIVANTAADLYPFMVMAARLTEPATHFNIKGVFAALPWLFAHTRIVSTRAGARTG